MDWFIKLFTREEKIAGLEVRDDYLRMALLQPGKIGDKPSTEIRFLGEEPLDEGVVIGGSIKDKDKFVKSVKKLVNRSPVKISFTMVSIPADGVYSKVSSFPKTIMGDKLKESMDLAMQFQLPDKPEETYASWEKIGPSDRNEVLVATILKKPINELVDALSSAGLRVVAVEFSALSICRSMDIKDSETVLVRAPQISGVEVFIVKNRLPYFVRVLPKEFLSSKDLLDKEVDRIADFFGADKGDIDRRIDISEAKIIDSLSGNPKIGENYGKWLSSIGIAMRAMIPRSADDMISLMSVGTEDAYEYQKAVAFSEFILESSIAVSLFFIAVFIIALASLSSFQQSVIRQTASISTTPLPNNSDQLQAQAGQLNNTLAITVGILRGTVDWSAVLKKLDADIIPGITLNGISMPSQNGTMSISGIAQTRDILNNFNATLEADTFLSNVNLPITNIDQSNNLPFNITFTISNPQALYYAQ
jgi:hypothetical protein